jgi:hypothetical protein
MPLMKAPWNTGRRYEANIYLFYGLFNDAASSSDCRASNDGMIVE